MPEPRIIYDGYLSFDGGVDYGRAASDLPANQVSRAINATFRGGYPRSRPKIKRITLTTDMFADPALAFYRFQGAGGYVDDDGVGSIFLSLEGELFRIDVESSAPRCARVHGDELKNNPNRERCAFVQAENFLIVQDGQSNAWIWDGIALTRAGDGQIPVGDVMAYGIGRLWVANGNAYYGGDLVNSDPALGRASLLRFTENDYLSEGGAFSVAGRGSAITGMAFPARNGTVSGEGSLMVFTRDGIWEFSAPVDRDVWKDLQRPIQTYALLDYGATSHESIVPVNGDLFYRSEDGVRSFFFAERDFSTSWGNAPVSREVGPVLARDSKKLLSGCSAVNFDGRLLVTAEPNTGNRGIYHGRLVVLDFDLITGMRQKLPPAWDGEWEFDGVRILQILTVDCSTGRRCFIIGLDDSDVLGLWELFTDEASKRKSETVAWELYLRSLSFQAPLFKKQLRSAEFWLDEIGGNSITVDGYYRRDNHGCWVPWARYSGSGQGCGITLTDDCSNPIQTHTVSAVRVGFPLAPASYDETACESRLDGYEFSVRLKFSGPATLKKLRLSAQLLDQDINPATTDSCAAIETDCRTCS